MRAALLTAPRTFEIVERPIPVPNEGEVLVRVLRVGICGSDVHIYKGEYETEQLPRVLGHEFAGEVVEVRGGQGESLQVGDIVTADINIGCGRCIHCRSRNGVLCERVSKIGIQRDGAFAEFISVPASHAIRLPPGMSPEIGALVEPAGCVMRSLKRSGLKAGDSLLVIGAGPMGMLHLQLAKALGAKHVTVLELDEGRAAAALSAGADAIARTAEDVARYVGEFGNSGGFDIAVECVGIAALYERAVGWIRPGGTLSCFGIEQAGRTASYVPFDVVLAEKSIVGSVGAVAEDMRDAIDVLQRGEVDTKLYTQHLFGLADADRAMRAFFEQKVGLKVQIDPSA